MQALQVPVYNHRSWLSTGLDKDSLGMVKYTYVSTGVFQKRLMCGTMTGLGEVTGNLDRTFQQASILDEIRGRQYVCIYKPLSEWRFYHYCHCLRESNSSFSGLSTWTWHKNLLGETSKSVVADLDHWDVQLLGLACYLSSTQMSIGGLSCTI